MFPPGSRLVALVTALALTGCAGEDAPGGPEAAGPDPGGGTHAAGDSGGSLPLDGSSGCGRTDSPPGGHFTLDVNGTPRTYIVKLPEPYDPAVAYRLVLAWHGFSLTADQVASTNTFANLGGFFALEPRAAGTAIFVAPQGLETTLAGTTAPGWDTSGRDVDFARALVDSLRASYCVDETRIFSAGVSMGGYLSNQLGCLMGDRFRAIASVIGGGPLVSGAVTCTGPMAAWLTHGTSDPINPFLAGQLSREHWARANHCAATTTPVGPAGCVAYDGCDEGAPVHWCEFDGGHLIPDFAPEGMWRFFAQF